MKMDSPRTMQAQRAGSVWPWVMLGGVALVLALLGGSSRPDMAQIAALRPAMALLLIPALYALTLDKLRVGGVPAALLGLLALWMALQLVPLPPVLWQALPDRDIVANLDRLIGADGTWRPISLVPTRGYNALASLIVPIAALIIALAFEVKVRALLLAIAGLGVLNALLGIAQVASGENSPLYFYAITTRGFPVGIFANENHSAVFSSLAMLVIVRLGLDAGRLRQAAGLRFAAAAAFLLVLIAVMIGASRAGYITALMALAGSGLMIAHWVRDQRARSSRRQPSGPVAGWVLAHPGLVMAGLAVVVAIPVLLIATTDQAQMLFAAMDSKPFEDMRWSLWPVLQQMMAAHWMVGTGFGSFEEVYHIYEPTELLLPIYLNQAHNDWAQLVIEAGLPGVMLVAALALWIMRRARPSSGFGGKSRANAVFWITIVAIIALGSAVDYPLRTPIFQGVVIWLLLALTLERRGVHHG